MNYKSYKMLSEDIKRNLFNISEDNYDIIVGIPRSGMIPAYMIGLYLNKNVTDLPSLINNRSLSKGITRKLKKEIVTAHDAERILIVDDSIMSGSSLKEAVASLPTDIRRRVTTLAIYSSEKKRDDVDIFFEFLPSPRVFEWNIYHHSILKRACVDID
ncbi:phosphoribosyltransferase, partial [Salinivibrio sp. VYel6]|uniref:phosphoribosyltransferase family protein n=1 Tax=Salinivibrio sp. VYel6 TaxID=2490493 RepID=UPI001C12CA61